jgi:CdiI immunity protein
MTKYPSLFLFFGGYLNEDWPDEYADEWVALDEYLRDNPHSASGFSPEVQALLVENASEGELRKVLFDDLGCAYSAERAGWKYRDWLQAMSAHVAKAIGHPQAS